MMQNDVSSGKEPQVLAHLLPDASDERVSIRLRKKKSPNAPISAPISTALQKAEAEEIRQRIMVPLLLRPTTASREGCLPSDPHWEVNSASHTWILERLSETDDLSTVLWHDDDANFQPLVAAAPPLLEQPVPREWIAVTESQTTLHDDAKSRARSALSSSPSSVTDEAQAERKRDRLLMLSNGRCLPPPPVILRRSEVLSILPQLFALRSVAIRHNYRLTRLPLAALHCLPFLLVLDLGYNALSSLPVVLLMKLNRDKTGLTAAFPDLLELYLDNNRLEWLPKEIFVALPRLQTLSVGNNLLAGFPSTLGNCATPDSPLRSLFVQNNVLQSSDEEWTELRHVMAAYDGMMLRHDTFFETISAGGTLSRHREKAIALATDRLPFARDLPNCVAPDAVLPSCEGTRVLLSLLRREEAAEEAASASRGTAEEEAQHLRGACRALETAQCNMCLAELLPLWRRYRSARNELLRRRRREALGPERYRSPRSAHDFSFFLEPDVPDELPPGAAPTDEVQTNGCPWELDEELLWLLAETITGGLYADRDAVLPRASTSADSGGPTSALQEQLATYQAPFASLKHMDVAQNTNVPLVYFLCGSAMCTSSLAELNVDGNAVVNYRRIDYSKLDPDTDDDD